MLSLVRSLGPLPGCFFFFFWGSSGCPIPGCMMLTIEWQTKAKGVSCCARVQQNVNHNCSPFVMTKLSKEKAIVPVSCVKGRTH